MSRNYRVEADIKIACEAAGVLPSAFDDFCDDYDNFQFDESGINQHIEKMRTAKPHRFIVQDDEQSRLAIEAFGPVGTLTKQGEYVRRFGSEAAKSAAALFGTKLGSTQRGVVPAHLQNQKAAGDHSRSDNPWSGVDARGFRTVDKFGRFLPAQITKQTNLVRALVASHGQAEGMRRAEAIAQAAGCRVGATRPAKVA